MSQETTSGAVGAGARRNTISDAFRRSARRNGDRVALTFAGREWKIGRAHV